MVRVLLTIFGLYVLCACVSDGPGRIAGTARVRDAVPRAEPLSKQGNPDSYVQNGKRYFVLATANGYRERGIASWYGRKFHGRRTSNGEVYDMYSMTAAHKTLPLPCYVRVTNLKNRRSIIVRVNDRGPFIDNRIIDLSFTGAEKLDMVRDGTALVEVVAVQPGVAASNARFKSRYTGVDDWRDESHLRDRIYIQLGAFSIRSNAENMVHRLLVAQFNDAAIKSVEEGGRVVHRVRIGPIHSVSATDEITKRLEELRFADYRIVVE